MNFARFFGRAWRNLNRRVSRAYLATAVQPSDVTMVRLGSAGNGWYAPEDLAEGALCYCIGVGLDASFDFALAARGAQVHAFDPTPMAIAYMERENQGQVTFHPWGAMDEDTTIKLYAPYDARHGSHFAEDLHGTGQFQEVPCLRMSTTLTRLGHDPAGITLMKMDIEGSWFAVIPDMIASGILPTFLEVEYDSPAPLWRVAPVHQTLRKAGYRLILREHDNAIYQRILA